MRSGSGPSSSPQTRARLLPSALLGALALALLWVSHAPAALASSEGGVTSDVWSGPAGTVLQIGISLSPDPPQQYILGATTTDPAQGGCANAQPFPGLAPITVGQVGGHTQLTWPASFGPGQYWFCASPQSGSGQTAHSFESFTVTPTPTATATPATDQLVSATVEVPDGGALPGSTVTIIVTAWVTPNNAPPVTVELVSLPAANTGMPLVFSSASILQPGDFSLTVTLPPTLTPGQYGFEVDGAYHVHTAFFDVVDVTPTPVGTLIGVQQHSMPGGTRSNGSMPPIALVLGGIALLMLGSAILIPSLLRRQRAAERQRIQPREEMWRR